MRISVLRSVLLGCLLVLISFAIPGCGDDDEQTSAVQAVQIGPIKILYIAGGDSLSIHIYDSADTVNGDVAPDRIIAGANTLIADTYGITHDSRNDSIFIGERNSDSVVIYDNASSATGNIAPSRHLIGGLTGFDRPIDLLIDESNDLLYVAGAHGIAIFDNASIIDGNVAPARLIIGAATTFSGESDMRLHLDTANDRLYVSDPGPPQQILVFDNISTLDGNVPPDRVIAGANTTLAYPWGLAVDVSRDILYVGDQGDDSVMSFANASTADGNIAPTRKIQGATSTIVGPGDLFIDEEFDTIYVADASGDQILIWENASQADGDLAPSRAIVGAATGFDYPSGVVVGVR